MVQIHTIHTAKLVSNCGWCSHLHEVDQHGVDVGERRPRLDVEAQLLLEVSPERDAPHEAVDKRADGAYVVIEAQRATQHKKWHKAQWNGFIATCMHTHVADTSPHIESKVTSTLEDVIKALYYTSKLFNAPALYLQLQ